MSTESVLKNGVAPFVLRLALGVVFLYHGIDKVSGAQNNMGLSWATNLWDRMSRPPYELVNKLDSLPGETPERIMEIKEKLVPLYVREAEPLPATLNIHFMQVAVAWGEIVGGAALLLGLLTRISAFAMILIQIGAIWTLTVYKGFSFAQGGGYEYNLALLAMCLALVLIGGGIFSLDHLMATRRAAIRAAAKTPAREPSQPQPVA